MIAPLLGAVTGVALQLQQPALWSARAYLGLLLLGGAPMDILADKPALAAYHANALTVAALAFAGASTPPDQRLIDAVLAECGPAGFAAGWLRHRGLDGAADMLGQFSLSESVASPLSENFS